MTTITIHFEAATAEIETDMKPIEAMKKLARVEENLGQPLEIEITKEELEND